MGGPYFHMTPGEKTYDAMKQHHNPTPSEIVQRYMFNSRFR